MNENEVIMLSSDEENDTVNQLVTSSTSSKTKDTTDSVRHPVKRIDCVVNLDIVLSPKNDSYSVCKYIKKPKLNTSLIEVVDLGVDDKNDKNDNNDNNDNNLTEFNDLSIKFHISNSTNEEEKSNSKAQFSQTTDKTENSAVQETTINEELKREIIGRAKEDVFPSTSSYNFFDEFVDLCAVLEDNCNDKKRLIRKLRRKYEKADVKYTKSKEFENLIKTKIKRVTKNNLYIIAKRVVSELKFYKKRKVKMNDSREEKITSEVVSEDENEKKKDQLIQRIKWVLDTLAEKIRELEEQEVDLSDEESSFIQLHKYRKRYCTISDRLFIMTNQTLHEDKITFTESKYPAVNKCIEKWLNETKKFPDFVDILKFLETQSSSLGLSKKDNLREIAVDIFQKVGTMLKRRRCCDFWDNFSDVLENTVDPSINDAELSEQLERNFQEGMKKEQEIINFYARKQDRENIRPEEVLDEDADKSPDESDSEEEEEDDDEVEIVRDETSKEEIDTPSNNLRETKNNFRNCKSLRWRCENGSPNNNNNSKCVEKPNLDKSVGGELSKQTKGNVGFINILEPRRYSLVPVITKIEDLKRKESPAEKMKKVEVNEVYSSQVNLQYDTFYKLDSIDEFFIKKTSIKKKKVFRDFTNVKSLKKIAGERKKYPVLFSQFPILHESWNIRCNLNVKKFKNFKVQKCGSNEDEKSEKNVRRNSNNSNSKEYSNSDNKEEESAYFSGSGNEENNNDDENKKKNLNTDNDEEEDQNEEDEDEENEAEENLHSKTTTSDPEIKTTLSAATEVKALTDVNSSLIQVKSEIIDVIEIKNIQTEHHFEVTTTKEVIIVDEVWEKDKKLIEKTNNDEENENIKLPTDCAVEDKKSPTVKKENEKKKNKISDKKDCPVIMDDEEEAIFIKQLNPIVEINTFKTPLIPRRSSCESKQPPTQSYVESQKLYEVETIVQRMRQQNSNQSPSDEERVKRFLLNSPSSISITPPKKLQCKNPLSQEALQALETLKNLKGISATRVVKEKPESEDDVIVIGESIPKTRRPNPRYQLPSKQRRLDQNPTDTHATKPSSTRLPASQLNQNKHLFNNCNNPPNEENSHDSSSIKISNVWGALSLKVYESISNDNNNLVAALDSESRQKISESGISGKLASAKKKTANQSVEYVVLD